MALRRIEIANPNSCLNQAEDDEPIFVLRANDENAATNVRAWASRYWHSKGGPSGRITEQQIAKFHEAIDAANEMETWRKKKGLW